MESLAVYESTSASDSTSEELNETTAIAKRQTDSPSSDPPAAKRPRKECSSRLPPVNDLFKDDPPEGCLRAWEASFVVAQPQELAKAPNRVRRFPHVEGNYATSVFIPVVFPHHFFPILKAICEELSMSLPNIELLGGDQISSCSQGSASRANSGAGGMFHISLSRVVAIRFPDIEMLIDSLKRNLLGIDLDRFPLALKGMRTFANDEATRTFVALKSESGSNKVCQFVEAINHSFFSFGLQKFYKEPNPHISIASILGDERNTLDQILNRLNQDTAFPCDIQIEVDNILCQVGKKLYTVWDAS